MLILNPRTVLFGDARWDHITLVAIDRTPRKRIEEWTDNGPYAALADIPEQRVRIRIVQELERDALDSPIPGEEATLAFYTAPAQADASRKKLSATAVVLSVEYELSLKKGAVRTITLAAISGDGEADPITITDAAGGEV